MKKQEYVSEILKFTDIYTKEELEEMVVRQLKEIHDPLVEEVEAIINEVEVAPVIDLEAIKAEMMAELKAQALAEAKEEMKAKIEEDAQKYKSTPSYKKTDMDLNRQVPVMNVTSGSLVYRSKRTGAEFNFSDYGDVEYIDVQELLSMRTAQRKFYDVPFIYILDEEIVEFLGLTKDYENIILADQIDNIFKKTQAEFEKIVENSPIGIKHSIVQRAKRLYTEGKLDSIKKIGYLNDTFSCEIGLRG